MGKEVVDVTGLSSGTYFLKLQADGQTTTQQVTVAWKTRSCQKSRVNQPIAAFSMEQHKRHSLSRAHVSALVVVRVNWNGRLGAVSGGTLLQTPRVTGGLAEDARLNAPW